MGEFWSKMAKTHPSTKVTEAGELEERRRRRWTSWERSYEGYHGYLSSLIDHELMALFLCDLFSLNLKCALIF